MVREILAFYPLPQEIVLEAELAFLSQKRKEIYKTVKQTETHVIYRACKTGLFSKWALTRFDVKYSRPFTKYDSFPYDSSGFWINHLETYYSKLSRNSYTRKEFINIILQLISTKETDTKLLRKRMLAISADLAI